MSFDFDNELYDSLEYKNGELVYMYLNITNACNLKCLYCYDENSRLIKNSTNISLAEYHEIAKDGARLGLRRVNITGGEPFVNKNWFEIAKTFFEEGIDISFSSNGTLITEDTADKIKSLNGIVQLSLDGNGETMDFVTQVPNVHNKVLKSLEILKSRNIYVMVNSVIGKHNYEMVKYLNQLSIEKDIVVRLSLYNSKINDANQKIKPLSIEEIDKLIYEISEMRNSNENIIMSIPPLLLPENHKTIVNPGCGWAYNVAGILSNGNVTVCGPASCVEGMVAGNIHETSFYSIWTESELFTNLRKNTYQSLKGICAECPVNKVCLGFCRLDPYIRTNDTCGPLSICQEYYEAMLDGRINRKLFPSRMLELA